MPPRKPSLQVAEVGASKPRSEEDRIRRTAALIEILKDDQDFAVQGKTFDQINLSGGRDFLAENDTYDVVILHSILSTGMGTKTPLIRGHEDELRVSKRHTIANWRKRLVETHAAYIAVCEGQPYTLSGWELGDLPGYNVVMRDQWVTLYRLESP